MRLIFDRRSASRRCSRASGPASGITERCHAVAITGSGAGGPARAIAECLHAIAISGDRASDLASGIAVRAYKRHGYILERAILESLRLCPYFEVWNDPVFQVASAVEHIVEGSIAEPTKLIGTDYPYSDGQRTLQVDAVVLTRIRAR